MDTRLFSLRHFLLAISIACASFPAFDLTYSSGLDEPLAWVFNFLADGHFESGKNIIFPHGPLAFLLYPLPMGNNLIVAILFALLSSVLFSMNVLALNRLVKNNNELLLCAFLVFIHCFIDLQLLLIGITLIYVMLFHISEKRIYFTLGVLFCVMGLFIKSYIGIVCGFILLSETVYRLCVTKKIKEVFPLAGWFLFFVSIGWFCLYHTLSGIITYFIGQFQLVNDNSESVSLIMPTNWWLIGLSLVALILIPLSIRDPRVRHYFLIMYLPFFAAWKHAMARQDDVHVLGFLNLLIFFYCLLFVIAEKKTSLVFVLSVVSIGAFSLNLAINSSIKDKTISIFRPFHLYNLLANYDEICLEKNQASQQKTAAKILPDTVLKRIGNGTVDVYPWNYAIIATNKLKWSPRPIIHSYATYTHWLDKKNADHLASAASADFMIWELNAFYDQAPTLESIDSRYLLNDGPESNISFFDHYRLIFKSPSFLLYQKVKKQKTNVTITTDLQKQERFDTWLEVPASKENCLLLAKVAIGRSFKGYLKSFMYKGEEFYITYEFGSKKTYRHRIVPKNAADGLWLSPLILNPDTNKTEEVVKRIKISTSDTAMTGQYYNLRFETVTFSALGSNDTLSKVLFGK